MQHQTQRGGDVALFIDWENFKISLAVGNRTPNVSALKEEVSNYGRVVIAKDYADWVTRAPELRGASQFLNDPPSLYAAGIEPVFVPTRAPSAGANNANGVRTGRIKNSVDVKMTADCIEIAHTYPNINTFVLVSGDSDFIHVVNALRTMGKMVTCIGVSWSTSRRLADQVDTLVLYDVDVDPAVPAEVIATPSAVVAAAAAASSPPSPSGTNGLGELQDIIKAVEEIIRDERKAGGNPLLTSIKQRLMRRYPEFDEKKLGYSGFKRLMARVAQDGNIRLITAGLVDWAIMADETIPDGATEATFSGPNTRPGRRRGRMPRSRQPEPVNEQQAPEAVDSPTYYADNTEAEPEAQSAPETADSSYQENTAVSYQEADSEPVANFATNVQQDYEDRTKDYSAASSTPSSPFGDNAELSQAIQEAISGLGMPTEPDDNQLADRVSDLIIMANTLEHQEGISHVAFNFLVSEICDALAQGLAAEHEEITQRWGQASSRTYVSKILRGLSDGEFFLKGNHSWRDETSGQNRRRRTFNLNQEHPLVKQIIGVRLDGSDSDDDTNGSNGDSGYTSEDESSGGSVDSYAYAPASVDSDQAQEADEAEESKQSFGFTSPVVVPDDNDFDEEEYELGKEAAEARGETGFISRLFRPKTTRTSGLGPAGTRSRAGRPNQRG
ncbi:MAG: NYN domain-containing protein [SAR202 cluster bacterium]|nr:NYN domain-containing protein [SAR202 cluster bacterium]